MTVAEVHSIACDLGRCRRTVAADVVEKRSMQRQRVIAVDAVFDQLRDGLKRIALRECNDTDSIPIIADPQFTAL